MSQQDLNRLRRAIQGQAPGAPGAVKVAAQRTTRDMHPTQGSHAIMQAATSGSKRPVTVSLNVTRAGGGSRGKAFCWGVPGFGWGAGEWDGSQGNVFSWGMVGQGWSAGQWAGSQSQAFAWGLSGQGWSSGAWLAG